MIPITRPWLPPLDEYVDLLREIWESKMLSNFGNLSQRLEQTARDYLGAPHVVAVSSADTGLILTLKALGLPDDAPCFISDFTFNSTINAALWNRLQPVLVDIDPGTLNMSPGHLVSVLNQHPPGVVLATHVFGNPCDIGALTAAASEHGSYLVFDAAHAYGSLYGERHVGTFGDAEVFSLSGTKPVTSAEGGLVATSHDWLAERLVYTRAYGFQNDYISRHVGMNGKLSELHSALGLLTLPHVESLIRRRAEIVQLYLTELQGVAVGQTVRPEDRSTFKDVVLDFGQSRHDVEQALGHAGVQVKRYFVPLHTMGLFAKYADGSYSATTEAYSRSLCLPAFAEIDDGTIIAICDRIKAAATA